MGKYYPCLTEAVCTTGESCSKNESVLLEQGKMEAPHSNDGLLIFHDDKKSFVNRGIIIKNGGYNYFAGNDIAL